MYELFFYTLSLFCRTRNPHLVIPKFSSSSIFCLTCFEIPASSTRAAPCYPKIWTRARTPYSSEIAPAAHAKSPFYPSAGNEAPRRGVKAGGGTLVTYPTFRTSASLSLGSPTFPFVPPPIRTLRPPKHTKPHAPPSASRPPPSRRLFPDYVIHRNSSPSLIHRTR